MSLSSDGKTVAIGAVYNNGDGKKPYSGHVQIYNVVEDDSSRSWKKSGQDIDGEATSDNSGISLSLSANGRTVAIGAIRNDDGGEDSGHVRIYNLASDEWKQIGQDIDGENAGDRFGSSVSMSSDGRMIAVGATYNDSNGLDSGKIKVYELNDSESWLQIGQDLVGKSPGDQAGWSVSLSSDGKTLAFGANGHGHDEKDYSGQVQLYHLVGTSDSVSWIQIGDIIGAKAGDNAGVSVSLSSDGKVVALGSFWNSDNGTKSGHVRVFGVDDTELFPSSAPSKGRRTTGLVMPECM